MLMSDCADPKLDQRMFIFIYYWLIVIGCLLVCSCAGPEEKDLKNSNKSFLTEITFEVNLHFVQDPAVDGKYYMPESIGSGGAFLDYDNDGDLDIYLLNGAYHDTSKRDNPPLTNHLYRQEADGKFTDVTGSSGLGDQGYGMGVAIGDIDNDGFVDVYISNDGPDSLYRNNGDGTFENITVLAGIYNPDWGISVTFLDYNLDNFLDIYVTNYVDYDTAVICTDRVGSQDYCGPQGFPGYPDRLFRNNGDLTFTDVTVATGIADSPSAGLGVISADFNNDSYPDIYVSNDRKYNQLWLNQKDGTFADHALMLGTAINGMGMAEASMGIALGDADNDLDMDLFLGHFRGETNTLYRNSGEIGFEDFTTQAGLGVVSLPYTSFGTGFFDYDHDGDLDIAVVNGRVIRGPLLTNEESVTYWDYYAEPNLFFDNDGTGKFTDISQDALEFTGQIENSRALVFGDIDNDGDIDLLVTNEGGQARLYRNDKQKTGNWLMVRAIDAGLKRDIYGAKVTVHSDKGSFVRLVNAGYSFCSSNDPRVHFGLGNSSVIEKVSIEWPGGAREEYRGIEPNTFVVLSKGEGQQARSGHNIQ